MEDLHNSRSARNFWVSAAGTRSLVGDRKFGAPNRATLSRKIRQEEVTLEAGFLWHKITRNNPHLGLRAEVINFVPAGEETVELMKVTLTNLASRPIHFTPTAAIPIYGTLGRRFARPPPCHLPAASHPMYSEWDPGKANAILRRTRSPPQRNHVCGFGCRVKTMINHRWVSSRWWKTSSGKAEAWIGRRRCRRRR